VITSHLPGDRQKMEKLGIIQKLPTKQH
jgi:hypothetical protein